MEFGSRPVSYRRGGVLIFTSCSYTDSNHGPHYVHIRTCMRSVSRTFLLRSIACSLFSSRSISLYHRSSSIPSSRYIPGSFLSLLHRALLFAPWSKSHAFPHVCLMLTLYSPPVPCLEYQTPDNSHWVWCKEHGKDFGWSHTGLGRQRCYQPFQKWNVHHFRGQKT